MRKARYAGRSWPLLRGSSSGPFSAHRTCWHGRAFEAEVMAQRVASVFRTEYTAPLQLGHHECHEVVEIARKQCRGENEAVAGLGLEPGLAVIGDLRRGADQGAAWGDAINELLHGKVFVRGQSFPPFQELAVDLGSGGVYIWEGTVDINLGEVVSALFTQQVAANRRCTKQLTVVRGFGLRLRLGRRHHDRQPWQDAEFCF